MVVMQCPQCHKCWLCHKLLVGSWVGSTQDTLPTPHLVVLSLQASDAWRLEAPHDLGDGGDVVLAEQPGLRAPCQNEELGALGVQRLLKETQTHTDVSCLLPVSSLLPPSLPLTIFPQRNMCAAVCLPLRQVQRRTRSSKCRFSAALIIRSRRPHICVRTVVGAEDALGAVLGADDTRVAVLGADDTRGAVLDADDTWAVLDAVDTWGGVRDAEDAWGAVLGAEAA